MQKVKILHFLLFAAAALGCAGYAGPTEATGFKPAACADTTPHKVRYVEVEPGVRLQVLEWGGTGKVMVLLTGGGDNAHVYDQFAYQFTDYYRVIGITRRGYLPSSQPPGGYDIPTRAADDIAVLDALGIRKAVFVGHSAAGAELSRLGLAHKDRVDKLIYLDALDLSRRSLPSRREPPLPDYTAKDLASLQAYQAAQARLQATREPAAAVCWGVRFDAHGAITESSTPDWIPEKIAASVKATPPVDWTKIEAPRLGIFAPYTLTDRQPWYWYLSPAKQAEFDAAWPDIARWFRRTVARFAEGNETNTHRLPGAPHYVYITNEAEVVRWIRQFLGIPPKN